MTATDETRESPQEARGPAVVIGAGVAGLVAARVLRAAGRRTIVLEASDRVGGLIAAKRIAGFRLDVGAESFATRGTAATELLNDLGLAEEIVTPVAGAARIRRGGELIPLPATGLFGIPADPEAAGVIRAIGPDAARTAAADLTAPIADDTRNAVTIAELVTSRMGRAVVDSLVAPIVRGVHSASPDDLEVERLAPGLIAKTIATGSLARAVQGIRRAAPAGSPVASIRGGMIRLIDALEADAQHASSNGGTIEIRRDARVTEITRAAGGWRLGIRSRAGDETAIDAATVLVATDERAALKLLQSAGVDVELQRETTSAEVVSLIVDTAALDGVDVGSGILVARGDDRESAIVAKALTFSSAKWAWVREALGPRRHALRLSYREGEADIDRAVHDAALLLDRPLTVDDVVGAAVTRWHSALPHAVVGVRARVDAVRASLTPLRSEGLAATGAWLDGTGLAAVIPAARAAAEAIA